MVILIQTIPSALGQNDGSQSQLHGAIDPAIMTSQKGIWATKWSFVVLIVTASVQVFVVLLSGSVALLVDTIHNFSDAATAMPLWIAFSLSQWQPSKKFTYGYGRVEELAGVAIVFAILLSAIVTGYESINRLFHARTVEHLWAVIAASFVGFLGNEAVAMLRIEVGEEIGSTALIADGHHARIDGFTSLAVVVSTLGAWLGYPLADPIVGLLISATLLYVVWDTGKAIFMRLLDGVDPELIDEIEQTAHLIPGVCEVTAVRARWVGHQLHADVSIAVTPEISVVEGHVIAKAVQHRLRQHLHYLAVTTIYVSPVGVQPGYV